MVFFIEHFLFYVTTFIILLNFYWLYYVHGSLILFSFFSYSSLENLGYAFKSLTFTIRFFVVIDRTEAYNTFIRSCSSLLLKQIRRHITALSFTNNCNI